MPRPGWLQRQFERAASEIRQWPDWMQSESSQNCSESAQTRQASPPDKIGAAGRPCAQDNGSDDKGSKLE
jgi:hypothetical protein